MAVRLSDHYFGEEEGGVDPPKPDRKFKIPELTKRRTSSLPASRAVLEENWSEQFPEYGSPTYTPYGKGVIVGINDICTHYKVQYRNDVFRRVIIRNCRTSVKLSDKVQQDRYATDGGVRSVTGRKYKGVDDELKHLGSDPVVLEQICEANGLNYGRWSHLNPGMQRMSIGNALRAKLKRGERIIIGIDQ